jgi:hypothetical protein
MSWIMYSQVGRAAKTHGCKVFASLLPALMEVVTNSGSSETSGVTTGHGCKVRRHRLLVCPFFGFHYHIQHAVGNQRQLDQPADSVRTIS